MESLNKIIINACSLSWKREFGPFVKCPECFGLLKNANYAKGKENLSRRILTRGTTRSPN